MTEHDEDGKPKKRARNPVQVLDAAAHTFLRKMKAGTSEPVFEKMLMNAMGIMKLKK